MPRPYFPHTIADIVRHIDGPMGVIVGDVADRSIWVLTRLRKSPGFTLVHFSDDKRSRTLESRHIADRRLAIDTMAEVIGIEERLA